MSTARTRLGDRQLTCKYAHLQKALMLPAGKPKPGRKEPCIASTSLNSSSHQLIVIQNQRRIMRIAEHTNTGSHLSQAPRSFLRYSRPLPSRSILNMIVSAPKAIMSESSLSSITVRIFQNMVEKIGAYNSMSMQLELNIASRNSRFRFPP